MPKHRITLSSGSIARVEIHKLDESLQSSGASNMEREQLLSLAKPFIEDYCQRGANMHSAGVAFHAQQALRVPPHEVLIHAQYGSNSSGGFIAKVKNTLLKVFR